LDREPPLGRRQRRMPLKSAQQGAGNIECPTDAAADTDFIEIAQLLARQAERGAP